MAECETRRVPLFLQSCLSVPAWLVLGAAMALLGAMLFPLGLTGAGSLGLVGVALALLGLACICRAVSILTQKVRLAPDHIARVTAFSRRRIDWEDVELCSTGLLVAQEPHHARFRVESAGATIRFRTRPDDYDDVATCLRASCDNAFFHDHVTGLIAPPAGDRFAGEVRERFRRVAARTRRRYLLVAVAQVLLCPGSGLLRLLVRLGAPASVIRLAFRAPDIAANFRRAREAARSFRMYLEGQAAGPSDRRP